MQQPVTDLFGQVPVSRADIDRWVEAVARLTPGTARAAWYVQAYDVPGKIRAAKLAGTFDQLTAERQRPAWWWDRFAWR